MKLPRKVIFWYGTSMFGKTILTLLNTGYLSYFYTQGLGIDIGIASSIALVAKLWDLVNDPLMGALVDYTKSKEGRCRVWMKWCIVPAGISIVLTYFCPELSGTGKIFWAVAMYLLQATLTTAVHIPANTLMGRITKDKAERAALTQSNTIFSVVANIIAGAFTMTLVNEIGGSDVKFGFLVVSMIYAVLYVLAFYVTYYVTKGYEPIDDVEADKRSPDRIPLSTKIKLLSSNKYYMILMASVFMLYLVQSVANGTTAYYVQYNMGNDMNFYYITSATGLIGAFIPAISFKFCVKKMGINGTAFSGCFLAIAGLFLRYVLHDSNMVVISAGSFLFNMGVSVASATILLNVFEAGVYGTYKDPDAVNNEAMLLSVESTCYQIGMTIGGPITGYILSFTSFVEGAETQSAQVLDILFNLQTVIPAVVMIIPCVVYFFMIRFEKKIPQMKAEIEARK